MRASKASAGGQLEQPSDVNSSTTTGTRARVAPESALASLADATAEAACASDFDLLCERMAVNAAAEAAASAATNTTTKSFLVIFNPPRRVCVRRAVPSILRSRFQL
jgi:hypothetical protein